MPDFRMNRWVAQHITGEWATVHDFETREELEAALSKRKPPEPAGIEYLHIGTVDVVDDYRLESTWRWLDTVAIR